MRTRSNKIQLVTIGLLAFAMVLTALFGPSTSAAPVQDNGVSASDLAAGDISDNVVDSQLGGTNLGSPDTDTVASSLVRMSYCGMRNGRILIGGWGAFTYRLDASSLKPASMKYGQVYNFTVDTNSFVAYHVAYAPRAGVLDIPSCRRIGA